jgi:pimeloyl-ACP methyl ester carboxylesterase
VSWLASVAWVLLGVAGACAALSAWVWVTRWLTRPGPDGSRHLRARCADGWSLAVYHRPAANRRFAEPVLLCHGLAANRYNFDLDPPYSLSAFLADAGFECFVLEWRGTGGSRRHPPGRTPMAYTVDDHVDQDGPAALELALAESGAPRAFWVGNSLGGLVGYGVAQGPHADKLAGLVTIGSPVPLDPDRFARRLLQIGLLLSVPWAFRQEVLSAAFAPLAGRVHVAASDVLANIREIEPRLQRQLLAHQIASIGRRMLLQLADWVQTGSFRSFDRRRDYRAGLANVRTPVLCAAGSADRMAPPPSVLAAFDRLGSTDKTVVVFGTEAGYAAEYGHADLAFGRCAPAEVYPAVGAWLEARATRILPAAWPAP